MFVKAERVRVSDRARDPVQRAGDQFQRHEDIPLLATHFTQSQKGFIFFLWALVQTGVPVFSGGFADRYGYKKTIATALSISIIGCGRARWAGARP